MRVKPWPHVVRAVAAVEAAWKKKRAVLLVMPTGAGKTVTGALLAQRRKVLWVAHRQQLVLQAVKELQKLVGVDNVGVVMAGYPENPRAPIQVGTVETLLARSARPKVDLLVLDEGHHYEAFSWRQLAAHYRSRQALVLGLTATPERSDGRGLGDVYEVLVEGACYSELLRAGILVPPLVYGPDHYLGKDYAGDPVEAWEKLSGRAPTFWFSPSVQGARSAANRLGRRGVPSFTVDWETPSAQREVAIEAFGSGKIRVLTNAFCLTEGVNVPDARVGLSTRAFRNVGSYIQAFGRLARAAANKPYSILIDLTGAHHVLGSPVADRVYSLHKNECPIREKTESEGEDDRAPFRRGEAVDEKLYVLESPLPPGTRYPVPVWRGGKVDVARAMRLGTRHGKRAALSVIDYEERR